MTAFPQYSSEEIKNFFVEKTGCKEKEVVDDVDIDYGIGCTGDDFHELINDYSVKFNVDMNGYLWYFHTVEEGQFNIGGCFFKTPAERVKHIAVTPKLLLDSANAGKWLLTYPEHTLPKRRYDILVNQVIVVLFITLIIYKCSK